MDKLNCYECKEWFETKDLIYLPEERFYLCRPCGCTFYAKRSVALRAELTQARGERDELRALMQEAIENCETGDCARCRTFAAALERGQA